MSKEEHVELAQIMKNVADSLAQRNVEDNRFHHASQILAKEICELFDGVTIPEQISLVDGFVIRRNGGEVLLTTACERENGKCEDLSKEGLFSSSRDERKSTLNDGTIAYRLSYETVEDFGRAVVRSELVACAETMAHIYKFFPANGWERISREVIMEVYTSYGIKHRFPRYSSFKKCWEKRFLSKFSFKLELSFWITPASFLSIYIFIKSNIFIVFCFFLFFCVIIVSLYF